MEEKGKTGNLIVGSAIIKSICKIYSPRIQCDLHIQPNEIVLKCPYGTYLVIALTLIQNLDRISMNLQSSYYLVYMYYENGRWIVM